MLINTSKFALKPISREILEKFLNGASKEEIKSEIEIIKKMS